MIPLGAYLIFGSAVECTAMCRHTPYGPVERPALLGCGFIMLAAATPVYWPLSGSVYPVDCPFGKMGLPLFAGSLSLLGGFVWHMRTYRSGQNELIRSVLAGWIASYFGTCFAFAVSLRQIGTYNWGLYFIVGVIVITKFADAGAYFAGRSLGKNKLCPNVSPGKTVEGLLGGILVSIFISWIYFGFFGCRIYQTLHWPWYSHIVLGLTLTLGGVAGDLLESIFKRDTGLKDSGNLLPGLGGLWDVTDSLLPGFVLAYLIYASGLTPAPSV